MSDAKWSEYKVYKNFLVDFGTFYEVGRERLDGVIHSGTRRIKPEWFNNYDEAKEYCDLLNSFQKATEE